LPQQLLVLSSFRFECGLVISSLRSVLYLLRQLSHLRFKVSDLSRSFIKSFLQVGYLSISIRNPFLQRIDRKISLSLVLNGVLNFTQLIFNTIEDARFQWPASLSQSTFSH